MKMAYCILKKMDFRNYVKRMASIGKIEQLRICFQNIGNIVTHLRGMCMEYFGINRPIMIRFDDLQNDIKSLYKTIDKAKANKLSRMEIFRCINQSFIDVVATMLDFATAIRRESIINPKEHPEILHDQRQLIQDLNTTLSKMKAIKDSWKDPMPVHSKYSKAKEEELTSRVRKFLPTASEQFVLNMRNVLLFTEIIALHHNFLDCLDEMKSDS